MEEYLIKQLSVFSENRPGRLASFAKAMREEGVNILAFSIAEADGFGVIRALVSNPDRAYRRLTEMGFTVTVTQVIAVGMKDEPGGLYEVAHLLGEAGINIDYAYAYSGRNTAVLILRVDKPNKAVEKIVESGGKLLTREDLQGGV